MTITLNLMPEIEQGLLAQAEEGVSLLDYVNQIVTREAHQSLLPPSTAPASEAKNLFALFAPVRGLLSDQEVDELFSRNWLPSRTEPV